MTQAERRRFLIQYLLKELPRGSQVEIPANTSAEVELTQATGILEDDGLSFRSAGRGFAAHAESGRYCIRYALLLFGKNLTSDSNSRLPMEVGCCHPVVFSSVWGWRPPGVPAPPDRRSLPPFPEWHRPGPGGGTPPPGR